MKRRCSDCRNGEHENYDNNILLVVVRDPDTKKFVKRSYMCNEHRKAYLFDGYDLIIKEES